MSAPDSARRAIGPVDLPHGAGDWHVIVDAANDQPLIPDGQYVARFTDWETLFLFNAGKVVLRFELVGGDFAGVRLIRPYRTKRLVGRPSKNGRFQVGRGSDLLRDVVTLTGAKQRPDRLSLAFFKGRLWNVKTRTVVHDSRQRPIPDALRYSVIDQIIGAETD